MPLAMPGQENDPPSGEITRDERVAWRAKGRGEADFLPVGESVEVVKAGAADDANGRRMEMEIEILKAQLTRLKVRLGVED